MLIDADTTRKNLKAILERQEEITPINVSKGLKDKFKEATELEGFKKFSIVLEDLIGQVNESYFETEKKLKIELEGFDDRATTSISCESKTWQDFKKGCSNNRLKVGDVIESIMSDYISQVEKSHKIKISNGKIKK